jgi:hypothetical protein
MHLNTAWPALDCAENGITPGDDGVSPTPPALRLSTPTLGEHTPAALT